MRLEEREGLMRKLGKKDVGKMKEGMVRENMLFLEKERDEPIGVSTK